MASTRLQEEASDSAVVRILEAGVQEFGTKGMAAATMSAIAFRAGISKQLIYHYYRKKEDLYCEVMSHLGNLIHAPFFETDFDSLPSLAALETFFNLLLDTCLVNREHFFTDQMLHSGDQMLRSTMQPLATRLIALLERLLSRAQADGSIRRGVKADFLTLQAVLLASGFSSARVLMSRYLNRDFTSPEMTAEWRTYAMSALMRTLEPERAH